MVQYKKNLLQWGRTWDKNVRSIVPCSCFSFIHIGLVPLQHWVSIFRIQVDLSTFLTFRISTRKSRSSSRTTKQLTLDTFDLVRASQFNVELYACLHQHLISPSTQQLLNTLVIGDARPIAILRRTLPHSPMSSVSSTSVQGWPCSNLCKLPLRNLEYLL